MTTMTGTVDFKRPHQGLGPKETDHDYIAQDNVIYAWSDSNCRYEFAWWLYAAHKSDLVKANLERYPFDRAWLGDTEIKGLTA